MSEHSEEVRAGERFEFGANWARFLEVLDEGRILLAESSLKSMLGAERLDGRTFVDIGSGSGLFSLVARRLGAHVLSLDYDPKSVACTAELRRRYFPEDPAWTVVQGSVLDKEAIAKLGTFDIVYSWGVLHHTGRMWEALANVVPLTKAGGSLFIAIYNDQGRASRRSLVLKRWYNAYPLLRMPLALCTLVRQWTPSIVRDSLHGEPLRSWRGYRAMTTRGMSAWHDVVDWIGGYPFEVAKPEQIFDFYRARGFQLERMTTCAGGHGCNEYVFSRST